MFWGEDRVQSSVTYAELYHEVSRLAQALRASGVKAGDRVAAYMPNIPGTVIAMLAATSIGAIWSSCSPDFGVQGVLDRFGQIEPRILFSADGYFYNGKTIDVLPRLTEIVKALPSVERVIVVPYTQRSPAIGAVPRAVDVHAFMAAVQAAQNRIRAAAVQSSALHHVFLRHHRRAEMHRARRRRHAHAAPEGTRAARRHQARRPHVLISRPAAG